MFIRGVYAALIAGAMATTPSLASAGFVSADFRSEFDLPEGTGFGPQVFENLSEAIAGAPDLSSADEIANPSVWGGSATTDLDASGLITLTGDHESVSFADFDLAVFQISNIVFDAGESIVGVSAVDVGLLDAAFGIGIVVPNISYTANSVTITYDTSGRGGVSDFESLDGGSSTFQIKTDTNPTPTVPVPPALPLMIGAVSLIALKVYRHKTA